MITDKKSMVDDFLKDLLVQVKYAKGLPAPACCSFAKNEVCGDIYRIFIDKKYEKAGQDIEDGLYMHEAGHIIFGHLKNSATKNSIQKMKVRAAYPKVAKRFDSQEQFEKYFDKMLFNIVEDFEVNSKLFTEEDYHEFDKIITNGGGFFPSDYDLPIGKDYNVYLNLILADPEAFFKKMKEKMQEQESEGGGESMADDTPDPFQNDKDNQNKSGSGEGNRKSEKQENKQGSGEDDSKDSKKKSSSGDGNSSGNGEKEPEKSNQGKTSTQKNKTQKNKSPLADNWKFSKKEIESLKQEAAAHDGDLIKQAVQKLENVQNTHNRGTGTEFEKLNEIIEVKSFDSLEKYITKELMKNTKTIKRDMLYNYNRNKIGTSVLIPAVRNETLTKKATIYAIVDTSGSVDRQLVQGFTGSFRKISKKLGYGSRVIYCNSRVEADYGPKDDIRPFTGGGTDIAEGIKYVKEKYNPKSKDVVYVISDFEDNMDSWNSVLDTMNCKKKGILWGNMQEISQEAHLDEVLSFEM